MLPFLKTNVGWIKDVSSIIFAGVGSIIAILTYLRAKDTLLQPIRTEVIKKQTELLSNLLELLSYNEFNVDVSLDYIGIVHVNTFKQMDEYGYVFKNHKEVMEQVEKLISGCIHFPDKDGNVDAIVLDMFPTEESDKTFSPEERREYGKRKYEAAKDGDAFIDRIYLTEKHQKFLGKVEDYAKNPFMPYSIQEVVNQVLNDVHLNISNYLRSTLSILMVDLYAKRRAGEGTTVLSEGVYNEFNRNRIRHNEDIKGLRKSIRQYLKIDKMP